MSTERFETIVIGGGQAGLAMGYHLARRGRSFVILDGSARIGDSWRHRWDSLRLFTPARYDGLPGAPFPAPAWSFPSHDDFADYLEDYATRFALPVRSGTRVRRLWHDGESYVADTDDDQLLADNVVVATGYDQVATIPAIAADLDPDIWQLHSAGYRNPDQLRPGTVLVVGAGNSGADIGVEVAATHRTLLSGRHPGQLPWRIDRPVAHVMTRLILWNFSHVLTVRTPIGRRMRPKVLSHSGPLIRVKSADIAAAGIERVPRVVGTRDGLPLLADDRTLDVTNVIWCTGYRPATDWIDLPVFDDRGEPSQYRGVVDAQPGLYFLGRLFQYALSSSMIRGVGPDAAHLANHLITRAATTTNVPSALPTAPGAPR